MREILFRGKRVDTGEWVYGSFVPDLLEVFNGFEELDGFIKPFEKTPDKRRMVEVERSTVGQYTGLTDKNGKKIFEGDIVRRETAYYGKHNVYDEPVVWEDDIENDSFGEPYTSGYCIHGGNWEVIGSIHDGEGGQ